MPYVSGCPASGIQTNCLKAGLHICTLPHSNFWHYRHKHRDRPSTRIHYCSAYRLAVQPALLDIRLSCTNLCSKTWVRNLWLLRAALPSHLYHATSFLILILLVLRLCHKLNHWKNKDKRNHLEEKKRKSRSFGDTITLSPTGSFMKRRKRHTAGQTGNVFGLGDLSRRRYGRQYLSQPMHWATIPSAQRTPCKISLLLLINRQNQKSSSVTEQKWGHPKSSDS